MSQHGDTKCKNHNHSFISKKLLLHHDGGKSPALEIVKNAPKIFKPSSKLSVSRSGFGSVARGISSAGG